MSKPASTETLLRHARTDINRHLAALRLANEQISHYRARATKAEQEIAEWKARFDALLKILPEKP